MLAGFSPLRRQEFSMQCRGLRGATTVEDNTAASLIAATRELLEKLVEANNLNKEDVAFAIFTTTTDLNSAFPAAAAREGLGWTQVPLMCSHEMNVPGSLPQCIRVLLLVNTDKRPEELVHIYLKEARGLRTFDR